MRTIDLPKGWGYKEIVKEGEMKYLKFSILKLRPSDTWKTNTEDRETVFLLLSGLFEINVNDLNEGIGPRKDVFSSKAHAVYVPRDSEVSIKAVYPTEIAIVSAPSEKKHDVVFIKPDDVRVRIVGQLNWRRHVHDVVSQTVPADMLLVGETFNPPGNWSSYPPHRHDVDNIPSESDMEEVYHFRVFPENGFGAQFIYTDDGSVDEIIKIRDGLTVKIDKGYHPVVAAPGYEVYYLWALAGEKRILIPRDDPKHAWIKAMEHVVRDW